MGFAACCIYQHQQFVQVDHQQTIDRQDTSQPLQSNLLSLNKNYTTIIYKLYQYEKSET